MNTFDNQIASKILQATLRSGRASHAYLFRGPPGSPKESAAFAFAAGLLCDNPIPDEPDLGKPCGSCYSCREVAKRSHPDLTVVEKEGSVIRLKKSHEILGEAMTRPFHSKRKVFIVQNAEDMNDEAANALLKLVEEPPGYVTFIMTTANITAIPETIVSRCQVVPFRHAVSDDEEGDEASLPKAQLGEDLLAEVFSGSPLELAARLAKADGSERSRVLAGLLSAVKGRLYRRITLHGSGDEQSLRRCHTAMNSVIKARARLDRNVNALLVFSTLFIELSKTLRGVPDLSPRPG